jgi:antitoxin component YwqK of YwqJK toxin-antitoxin module
MEVISDTAPETAAATAATPDTATCYICYEDATAENPYIDPSPCACTGSIKLHFSCFKEVNQRSPNCGICKSKYRDVNDYPIPCDFIEVNGYRYVGTRMVISEKFVGNLTIYYSSGVKYATEQYSTKGELHGKYKQYYENGTIRGIGYYKNGELHGPYATYYENGVAKTMIEYEDDEYHGCYVEYFEDGTPSARGKYVNGHRDGEYVKFYENGDYYCKLSYTDGILDGNSIYYYQTGGVEEIVPHKDGEMHGTAKYYNEDGIIEKEIIYTRGIAIDETRYDEVGKMKYTRNFQTGIVLTYDTRKPRNKRSK